MKQIDHEPLYRDGKHYDIQHKNFKSDIPFYLDQSRKYDDPILELACGTGRLTIPIAKEGYNITGLDVSEGMLEKAKENAREKKLAIKWIRDDVRTFNINEKYKLIIFPFNSIAHLHDLESIDSCFKVVKKHLKNDGRFILDMFNPDFKRLIRNPKKRFPVYKYPDPDSKATVVITESNTYDAAKQINYITWLYKIGKKEFSYELNMRIFFPQELDALLTYNGFIIENKYGGFDCSKFNSKSEKQILVCKLK